MAKKIFISFLGTGLYKKCMYRYPDKSKSNSVTFVQESTLSYLIKSLSNEKNPWTDKDIAYILLTPEARKKNWEDGYEFEDENGSSFEQEEGLETSLSKLCKKNPFLKFKDIDISDESSKNIWMLFDKLYDLLVKNESEKSIDLYIDVTHSFRYLPMFLIVFINYVKMFKTVEVKHISYGNWEDRDESKNEAPIVDLTDYSKLQDWTYATRSFLESGNANGLVGLCQEESLDDFAGNIRRVIADFQTCRSIPIVEGSHIESLNSEVDRLIIMEKETIPPLENVLEEIKKQFSDFAEVSTSDSLEIENVMNGYEAAIWCFNKQLYQQAVTILRENINTENCLINGAISEDCWKDGYGYGDYEVSNRKSNSFISDNNLKYLFNSVRYVRNDFDHAGFTKGTSEDYYDGWDNAKVIQEIQRAFKRLIDVKYKGKKKMTERNGIPYIENIKSK